MHSAVHQSVKGASYLYLDTLLTMRIGQLDRMTTLYVVGIMCFILNTLLLEFLYGQIE